MFIGVLIFSFRLEQELLPVSEIGNMPLSEVVNLPLSEIGKFVSPDIGNLSFPEVGKVYCSLISQHEHQAPQQSLPRHRINLHMQVNMEAVIRQRFKSLQKCLKCSYTKSPHRGVGVRANSKQPQRMG